MFWNTDRAFGTLNSSLTLFDPEFHSGLLQVLPLARKG